jgi:mannosyltransferase
MPAVLLGALALILGLVTLSQKSLWFDETYDAVTARETWHAFFWGIQDSEMSQSAYLILLKLWTSVASSSAFALRLPSVVFAVGAVVLIVPLGTRLFDRFTGIVAGVFLATNEMIVSWSQQARSYTMVTFAVVLTGLLFCRALADPRWRNWLLYAFSAAFAVYCHFYGGFVVVAELASLPFLPRRPPLRRVGGSIVLFALLVAPALYFTDTAGHSQLNWIPSPSPHQLERVAGTMIGHNPLAGIAALGGLAVLAFKARRSGALARWQLALVAGWLCLPLVLGALVSVYVPIFVPRYAIVVTPAVALAEAVLIAAFAKSRPALAVAAGALVVAVSSLEIARWYRSVPEDWRGAAAYVQQRVKPGDSVVVAPEYATSAYYEYDHQTPLGLATPIGRTFVIVRTDPRGDDATYTPPGVTARAALGDAPLRLAGEKPFGQRLEVLTYEPSGVQAGS